jgi:hypothetical protein
VRDAFKSRPASTHTQPAKSSYPHQAKMSEPMDVDMNSDFPQDQPPRSQPETPHADYDDDAPVPRRRRAIDDLVEKVTDETGEMVRGAFLQFLETYVPSYQELMIGLMMISILRRLNRVHREAHVNQIIFISRNLKKLNDLDYQHYTLIFKICRISRLMEKLELSLKQSPNNIIGILNYN